MASKKQAEEVLLSKQHNNGVLSNKKQAERVHFSIDNSVSDEEQVQYLQAPDSTASPKVLGASMAQKGSWKEGTSGDEIVLPVIMKDLGPSTIVLHNTFELLEASSN